jgi:hypothetical protein
MPTDVHKRKSDPVPAGYESSDASDGYESDPEFEVELMGQLLAKVNKYKVELGMGHWKTLRKVRIMVVVGSRASQAPPRALDCAPARDHSVLTRSTLAVLACVSPPPCPASPRNVLDVTSSFLPLSACPAQTSLQVFRLLNLYIQHYMLNKMDDLLLEFADTCKGELYGSTHYIKYIQMLGFCRWKQHRLREALALFHEQEVRRVQFISPSGTQSGTQSVIQSVSQSLTPPLTPPRFRVPLAGYHRRQRDPLREHRPHVLLPGRLRVRGRVISEGALLAG